MKVFLNFSFKLVASIAMAWFLSGCVADSLRDSESEPEIRRLNNEKDLRDHPLFFSGGVFSC